MRYGTRTEAGKRWMPCGERPVCRIKLGYEFGYLYTAICPYNGDLFAMFLPNMTTTCFDIFVQNLAQHAQKKVTLILDRAKCHTTATHNEQVELMFFPPACPELNPVERFFKELRKCLKSKVFHLIEDIENKIQYLLEKYWQNAQSVVSITKFPYFNTT